MSNQSDYSLLLILLSGSSRGESSVMRVRVRLEGHKKHHYEYALAHYEYALGGSDVYSTSTNMIFTSTNAYS